MRLHEISDLSGARRPRKRLGRGIGSGLGKTGGRGGKGQTARSGGAKAGFEGGQMPIYRRLPKRGFRKPNALRFNEVSLSSLHAAVESGRLDVSSLVDCAVLRAAGVINKEWDGVRILGNGVLGHKMSFRVHHVTAGARHAIEAAGGTIDLIPVTSRQASVPSLEK